jgi:hypothetical protein
MSESNNVKFVESDGKWLWKLYGTNGSVVHRSNLFDTEQEARSNYEAYGNGVGPSNAEEANTVPEAPQQAPEGSTAGPEADLGAGNAGQAEETADLDKTVGESADTLSNPNA